MTERLVRPSVLADRKSRFDAAFNRLAKATRMSDVDVHMKRIYYATLADLPIDAIEAAEANLRRTTSFFPSSGEWHQAAVAIVEAQRRALICSPPRCQQCDQCRDTGWVDVERNGKSFAVECSCRSTNTNYQRAAAASRKSANQGSKG